MTARELIVQADEIRQRRNLSQAEWSRKSGLDDVGMVISRAYNSGNCKLTVMVSLLKSLGYELRIVEREDLP